MFGGSYAELVLTKTGTLIDYIRLGSTQKRAHIEPRVQQQTDTPNLPKIKLEQVENSFIDLVKYRTGARCFFSL